MTRKWRPGHPVGGKRAPRDEEQAIACEALEMAAYQFREGHVQPGSSAAEILALAEAFVRQLRVGREARG